MIFLQLHQQLFWNGFVGASKKRAKNARGTPWIWPGNLLRDSETCARMASTLCCSIFSGFFAFVQQEIYEITQFSISAILKRDSVKWRCGRRKKINYMPGVLKTGSANRNIFCVTFSQLPLSNISFFTVLFTANVGFFLGCGCRQNYHPASTRPYVFVPTHNSLFNTSDSYLKTVRV